MSYKKFGALSSSTDPNQLAKTVEAVLMGAGVLVTFLAWKLLHIQISPTDMAELAGGAGAFAANVMLAWGLIRKALVYIAEKRAPQA